MAIHAKPMRRVISISRLTGSGSRDAGTSCACGPRPREKKEQWLLIKGDDEYARKADDPEIVEEETTSILSGRTNDELAASGAIREDHAARANVTAKRTAPPPSASKVKGAKKGILPPFVEPELATLGETAPSGDEWVHEIKFDGFRLQARIDGGRGEAPDPQGPRLDR